MAQPFATALIEQTVNAFNGDVTYVSPLDGIKLIDNWISALTTEDDLVNPVADSLSELRLQLRSGNPNETQITGLLAELASQTKQAAQSADESSQQIALNGLASAIESFGQQLAGKRGPTQTGGDGTVGPTVGGISSSESSTPGGAV